jgi:predicted transcriptional regulator
MSVPWSIVGALFKFLAPSIPDIIDTVRSLKKEQQREKIVLDDASLRLQELEQRIVAQLQLIEQLTAQVAKLEKAVVWALWAALFALVLALIALGVVLLG